MLSGSRLLAPTLLRYECASVIRRHERARLISTDQAVEAYEDLLALEIEFWPHEVIARRIWELRGSLNTYDAGYVAVAEVAGASLVTLDERIAPAPGLRCAVHLPPAG